MNLKRALLWLVFILIGAAIMTILHVPSTFIIPLGILNAATATTASYALLRGDTSAPKILVRLEKWRLPLLLFAMPASFVLPLAASSFGAEWAIPLVWAGMLAAMLSVTILVSYT